CPFHSGSLPRKSDFLQEMDENALFRRYVELLGKFLQDRPVVIVQASSKPATPTSARLTWIVRVAGLNLDTAELVPLVEKGAKTTVAAWVSGQPPKALVLTMGGNNLPGDEGLRKLGARLRETRKQRSRGRLAYFVADGFRLGEKVEIIGAAGFGIGAGHIESAEGMRADHCSGAFAIDVKIADVEFMFGALDFFG